MHRTLIQVNPDDFPAEFHALLSNCPVYDSSCSPTARVLFIDRDGGYYLKSAPKDTLRAEAEMTAYFHQKGMGAQVHAYLNGERDWLLTARVPGEDCTHAMYLENPERLCDTIALRLRALHELDASDCPVLDRIATYKATAERNYAAGTYDQSQFPDSFGYASAEAAWAVVQREGHCLKNEVLLHGDYCLPNIMLNDWAFTGFIDLGNGGVGDRHIDLFWGIWSLGFNLKTDRYRNRFLDAYGRELVDEEKLRVVAAFEVFG